MIRPQTLLLLTVASFLGYLGYQWFRWGTYWFVSPGTWSSDNTPRRIWRRVYWRGHWTPFIYARRRNQWL